MEEDMKFLSNRYTKVFCHCGINICTLKSACPAKGDSLGYVIDDKRFAGREFNLLDDAVKAIDEICEQEKCYCPRCRTNQFDNPDYCINCADSGYSNVISVYEVK